MSSGERGSVTVVAAAAVGLIVLLTVWLGALAAVIGARQSAVAAADAAALAAAPVTFLPFGATGSPTDEAAIFAARNGSRLVSCDCPVDRSFEPRTVEVRVARVIELPVLGSTTIEATAKADFIPALLLDGR